MKDPLQPELTPYEALGVLRGATASQLDQAFKRGVAQRQNVNKLNAAKRALADPIEAALVDTFLYDDANLARLDPNPLTAREALAPERRAATLVAWQAALRAAFPEPAIAHCIGVASYHGALFEEERTAAGAAPGPLAAAELWEWAIACLVASTEAGVPWNGLAPEARATVATRIHDKLRQRLEDVLAIRRDRGLATARHDELLLALATEFRTARELAEVGVRKGRAPLACGPLLLQRLDLLEEVRAQVAAAASRAPGHHKLDGLRRALSPHASIEQLLERNRPEAALEALAKLPRGERGSREQVTLRARARLALGRQKASLGELDAALAAWGDALADADAEQAGLIRREIVSVCQARAATLAGQDRAAAIALLERGLKLADDTKLKSTLAELVAQGAIETINRAQKEASKGGLSEQQAADIERGVKDLERAAQLGSARAQEQLQLARGVAEQARTAGQAAAFMQDVKTANEAAGRGDWDTAVERLRAAITRAGASAPDSLQKNLAVSLANRSVQRVNRAAELMKHPPLGLPGRPGDDVQDLFRQVFEHDDENSCALCHKPYYGGSDWTEFPPADIGGGGFGGRRTRLCRACNERLQQAVRTGSVPGGRRRPPAQAVSLLRGAHQDLQESLALDPKNRQTRQSLKQVGEMLKAVGESLPGPAHGAVAARVRGPRGAAPPLPALAVYLGLWWLAAGAAVAADVWLAPLLGHHLFLQGVAREAMTQGWGAGTAAQAAIVLAAVWPALFAGLRRAVGRAA